MAVRFFGGEKLTKGTDKLSLLDMVHIEIREINFFYLFLNIVQINFIFTDNVHILSIYGLINLCGLFSFIGGENLTKVTDKLAILDMVHIEIR
jgi:hypothetical protein